MSKVAVWQDLKYYGVEDVNEDVIERNLTQEVDFSRVVDCLRDLRAREQEEVPEMQKEVPILREQANTSEKRISCKKVAFFCFMKHIETNSLVIDGQGKFFKDICQARSNEEMFDECLRKFGLKYNTYNSIGGTIELSKLPDN